MDSTTGAAQTARVVGAAAFLALDEPCQMDAGSAKHDARSRKSAVVAGNRCSRRCNHRRPYRLEWIQIHTGSIVNWPIAAREDERGARGDRGVARVLAAGG